MSSAIAQRRLVSMYRCRGLRPRLVSPFESGNACCVFGPSNTCFVRIRSSISRVIAPVRTPMSRARSAREIGCRERTRLSAICRLISRCVPRRAIRKPVGLIRRMCRWSWLSAMLPAPPNAAGTIMIQNPPNVPLMVQLPRRPVRRSPPSASSVVVLVACVALCSVGAVMTQTPGARRSDASDGSRLFQLQREAVSLLKRAARADASIDEVRPAVNDAVKRFEALGAEPDTLVGSELGTSRLPPPLRAELRRAARELSAASPPGSQWRVDTSPFLALLERVRVQLEGEIALGLTLEGSYSQTKPKEPAYGGHASTMGPAPPDAHTSGDHPAPSPASFREGGRLPTITFGGSPTKDHILE